MTRYFRLALLIGALFGLMGQSVAMAMSPNCAAAMMQPAKADASKHMAMGKMDCCPEVAGSKHDSKPSSDGMPGCPMMAGCFVTLAMNDVPWLPEVAPIKAAPFVWSRTSQMLGRSTAPEPPPPTI